MISTHNQKLSLKANQSSKGSVKRKPKQTPHQTDKQFFADQLLKSEIRRENSKLRRALMAEQRVRG